MEILVIVIVGAIPCLHALLSIGTIKWRDAMRMLQHYITVTSDCVIVVLMPVLFLKKH